MPTPTNEEVNEFAGCVTTAEMLVAIVAMDGMEMMQAVLCGVESDKASLRKIVAELERGGADAIAEVVCAQIPKTKLREPRWVTERRKREIKRYGRPLRRWK